MLWGEKRLSALTCVSRQATPRSVHLLLFLNSSVGSFLGIWIPTICSKQAEMVSTSLRKQLILCNATTGFPVQWHLRNEWRKIPNWWYISTQIWVVLLIGCAVWRSTVYPGVICMEFLFLFLRCHHYAGKPVVVAQNVSSFCLWPAR